MLKFLQIATLSFLLIAIFGCSSKDKSKEKTSAEALYLKAKDYLDDRDFIRAAENFEQLNDDFPFSKWSEKGQTMAIYARYKEGNCDKIFPLVEDFIRLNPNSEYVVYAIYMKGTCYFDKIPDINRAQDDTQQASYAFRELAARFPNSNYISDIKEKLKFVDEHLAGREMSLGRAKIKLENYIGAIKNFQYVIDRYGRSNQAVEAYFRIAEIYHKLGLKKESNNSKEILITYYPESEFTKIAKEKF